MQKVNAVAPEDVSTPRSLSARELQDARALINVLMLAWKNYGLYPGDHTSTIKAFENLAAAFGNFFAHHGALRLTVEKDRLLCGSEIIYEVSQENPSEDIISLLYRDGIKWIEFQEGLTFEEIAAFFRIANKYRLSAEEIEGDIVTSLLDEELEYIDFKAVDIFWQDLLLMDFSQLPTSELQPAEAAAQEEAANENELDPSRRSTEQLGAGTYARSIADPSIGDAQLALSDADYAKLQQMVKEEENWEVTEDLFEVLLIILKSQAEEEKFAAVLGFVSEEVAETIELEKFELLSKLFRSLHQLHSREKSSARDWKSRHIELFFQDLSRPEVSRLIGDKLLKLDSGEIEKLRALNQVLHYFPPGLIPFLVPAVMQRNSPEIQQLLSESIAHLSRRDLGPLEKVAEQHGAEMGEKLLAILDRLQGDRVNEILFGMRGHTSDQVRRKAIKELVARDPQYTQRLFPLIDDPNQGIRALILAACAKQKSTALEKMLLDYLAGNFTRKDPDHILACYKALGRCGSDAAVPFLREILLSRGWNSFLGSGNLIFREGAAVALALLDTPRAREVIRQAANSRFKVIGKALTRAKTICGVSGENTND
jgi:hypothetical protein